MTLVSRRSWLPLALAALLIVLVQRSSSAAYDIAVTNPRVSVIDTGEVVVTMDTTGALRGMLTVKLTVDGAGTITNGEWALVSRYVEDLNADGTVDPDPPSDESAPHQEYIRLVDRGTLAGAVTGGLAATATDGSLLLTNVRLAIGSGSLTFDGITSGSGVLNVDPRNATQGTLRLDF